MILHKSCYFLTNPKPSRKEMGSQQNMKLMGFWWIEDFVSILQASEKNIVYHVPRFWILVISNFHMKLFMLLPMQGRKSLLCVVIVSHIYLFWIYA
jgi:hypothetical protein